MMVAFGSSNVFFADHCCIGNQSLFVYTARLP